MKDLILFGSGNRARFMAYYFMRDGVRIAAITVDEKYITEKQISGIDVVPFEGIEKSFDPRTHDMFVAIGPRWMNRLREQKCREASALGYNLTSYVSKTALTWDGLQIHPNTKIGDRTLCQPFSQIGRNVSIGSGCLIGHDTVVADHCFLASGVVTGGAVTIGANSFLGTGCVIRDGLKVGARCIIGAGVTLLEPAEDDSVYMNTSARKMPLTSDKIQF